jgi:hypothetical protein
MSRDNHARDFPVELINEVSPQLYRRLQQLFELAYSLQQTQAQVPATTEAVVARQLQLLGVLREPLVGQEVADPQLVAAAQSPGAGTVISVTAGSGLSGGVITTSGTITLIIGAANALQKSNGTQLVDSRVTDDGNDISLNSTKKVFLGVTHIMTIDDSAGLVILNLAALPVVDPSVPGALWTDGAGGLFVSP